MRKGTRSSNKRNISAFFHLIYYVYTGLHLSHRYQSVLKLHELYLNRHEMKKDHSEFTIMRSQSFTILYRNIHFPLFRISHTPYSSIIIVVKIAETKKMEICWTTLFKFNHGNILYNTYLIRTKRTNCMWNVLNAPDTNSFHRRFAQLEISFQFHKYYISYIFEYCNTFMSATVIDSSFCNQTLTSQRKCYMINILWNLSTYLKHIDWVLLNEKLSLRINVRIRIYAKGQEMKTLFSYSFIWPEIIINYDNFPFI